VKRHSEQVVVQFLKAAANNDGATVDRILDEGAIEVDDSDGAPSTVVSRLQCVHCLEASLLSCIDPTPCRCKADCTAHCCCQRPP
jgi:hypothetical protein